MREGDASRAGNKNGGHRRALANYAPLFMQREPRDSDKPSQKIPWWLWPHVLSLEAPVVIVAWQGLLARLHHARLMPGVVEGLALAAWLVYLMDRLLDARRAAAPEMLGARHAFYHRHQTAVLWCVAPVVAAALLWMALFQVPHGLLWSAGGIAVLCSFYLAAFAAGQRQYFGPLFMALAGLFSIIILSSLPVPSALRGVASVLILMGMWAAFLRHWRGPLGATRAKAPVGALLIALGCSVGVWFFASDEGAFGSWVELLMLWSVFYCNLAAISAREGETPPSKAALAHSGAAWGRSSFFPVPFILALVVVGVRMLMPMPAGTARLCVVVLASIGLMSLLWLARRRFSDDAFRVLADICLLMPAVLA